MATLQGIYTTYGLNNFNALLYNVTSYITWRLKYCAGYSEKVQTWLFNAQIMITKKNFVRDRTSVSILLTHSHLKVIAALNNIIKYTIEMYC